MSPTPNPSRVQISFLGVGPKHNNGGVEGYRKTTYRFADGATWTTRNFMGALSQWMKARGAPIDTLIVAGTATSLWFALNDIGPDDDVTLGLLMELDEATHNGGCTQAMLDRLADHWAEHTAFRLRPVIIGRCETTEAQLALVEHLARHIAPGAEIVFDITHGFRHLPLIGMTAMHYLTHARRCRIQGIYYGLYDPDSGDAPVIALDGLLRIQEISEALAQSHTRGTLTPLSRALDDAELPDLDQATFLLDTMQLSRSKKACDAVIQDLHETDRPLLRIARDELESALTHNISLASAYHTRQHALGLNALRAGDYTTCATMLLEALITAALQANNPRADVNNYDQRIEARSWLHQRLRRDHPDDYRAYITLSSVRNALAHGHSSHTRSQAAQRALHDRARLEAFLHQTCAWLPEAFARLGV